VTKISKILTFVASYHSQRTQAPLKSGVPTQLLHAQHYSWHWFPAKIVRSVKKRVCSVLKQINDVFLKQHFPVVIATSFIIALTDTTHHVVSKSAKSKFESFES